VKCVDKLIKENTIRFVGDKFKGKGKNVCFDRAYGFRFIRSKIEKIKRRKV
jgi:hypothetical protein